MPVKTKSRVPENMDVTDGLVDARAKQVLREAVDAVVNSFAKHTQGYGRGNSKSAKLFELILILIIELLINVPFSIILTLILICFVFS